MCMKPTRSDAMRALSVVALAACATARTPKPDAGVEWPAIVDSHVHLAYWPVADELAARGVGAVVDLGAPERTLGGGAPIEVVAAGPMLTHPGGYPLDAWGEDGYGIGCADAACVRQ